MLRAVLLTALVVTGCSKDKGSGEAKTDTKTEAASSKSQAEAKLPAPSESPSAATGPRTVPIEANIKGYVPDTIPGKPGEKLKLVFTRTIEGECLAELKTPDGKVVELPMNKPVEIDVTVPDTGKLTFACGMDMFQGQIVADAKG